MAISRWAICLALSLACWMALALVVWAQAPTFPPGSRYAPRTVRPVTKPAAAPAKPAAAEKPALPASDPLVKWQLLGHSTEGRPIEYVQFGTGEHQVLVVGALRGNEPEGVALAQSLASHLAHFPRRLGDVTITIVRDPNPDGRAHQTAGNSHGVELNQNFLAMRQAAGRPPGPVPVTETNSQAETVALVELLQDIKPERVILLGTTDSRATVTLAGPAEQLAAQVALEVGTQARPLDTSAAPGALLTFTGVNLAIPSLEIATIPRSTADAVWSQLKRGVMTAVGCGTPMPFVPVPVQPRRPKPPVAASAPAASRPPVGANSSALTAAAPFAASPTMPAAAAAPAGPTPQPLSFNQLSFGRPTVKVQSPRSLRPRQPAKASVSPTASAAYPPPALHQPVAANARPVVPGADPRVQRLPPVLVNQRRQDAYANPPLPQRPIPVYPTTGQ